MTQFEITKKFWEILKLCDSQVHIIVDEDTDWGGKIIDIDFDEEEFHWFHFEFNKDGAMTYWEATN